MSQETQIAEAAARQGKFEEMYVKLFDTRTPGVQRTPTFFINGEKFEEQATYDALKSAVEGAPAQ